MSRRFQLVGDLDLARRARHEALGFARAARGDLACSRALFARLRAGAATARSICAILLGDKDEPGRECAPARAELCEPPPGLPCLKKCCAG
jgi:hypothetical protein